MASAGTDLSTRPPIRLWPGVAAAILLLLGRLVVPVFAPDILVFGVVGGVLAGVAIVVWWGFFSRAPRAERWTGAALMVAALVGTWFLVDVSIATGAMGGLLVLSALPTLGVAVVIAVVATARRSDRARRIAVGAAILIGCGLWTLVRTDGMTSDVIGSDFRWRWTPTAEERLLATAPAFTSTAAPVAPVTRPLSAEPATALVSRTGETTNPSLPSPAAETTAAPAGEHDGRIEWPGFRGRDRHAVVTGVQIDTAWATSPPVLMWRRAIGPGWSSFAVAGDVLYTQEQRGDNELIASYRVSTGEPIWQHRDTVRFWESNGGAGPRATPTLDGGRVYAFGATGILNALDARTGARLWSRHVAADTGVAVPDWGFSSSPLVFDGVVIVSAYGTLAAYDAATGAPRWVGPRRDGSYSSPHPVTIGGIRQVVMLSAAGATSVSPRDGAVLWEHEWPNPMGGITQPAVTAEGDVLINGLAATSGTGIRRLSVQRESGAWTTAERWTSIGLKPYFNDFVLHEGHAYGFDGNILASISLDDGARRWKGGRYGNGQMVLLADQDLLLVTSEDGELVLVAATPDRFAEIARVPALAGKTWNHPVVVGHTLLVRNGEEMAAFRLPRRPR